MHAQRTKKTNPAQEPKKGGPMGLWRRWSSLRLHGSG